MKVYIASSLITVFGKIQKTIKHCIVHLISLSYIIIRVSCGIRVHFKVSSHISHHIIPQALTQGNE